MVVHLHPDNDLEDSDYENWMHDLCSLEAKWNFDIDYNEHEILLYSNKTFNPFDACGFVRALLYVFKINQTVDLVSTTTTMPFDPCLNTALTANITARQVIWHDPFVSLRREIEARNDSERHHKHTFDIDADGYRFEQTEITSISGNPANSKAHTSVREKLISRLSKAGYKQITVIKTATEPLTATQFDHLCELHPVHNFNDFDVNKSPVFLADEVPF